MDVEEGGDSLDGAGVLCVVEEIALTGLVFGMPLEDVELGVVGALRGWGFRWGVGEGGGGVRELGNWVGRVWVRGELVLLWIVGGQVWLRRVGRAGGLLLEVGGLGVGGGLVGEGHLEGVSLELNELGVGEDS